MRRPRPPLIGIAVIAFLLVGSFGSSMAFEMPTIDENGLTANETATLWSRDDDSFISAREYRERFGENRVPMAALANATDITFKRPPETAATWTRNDFPDLTPGTETVSIYPPNADRQNGTIIRDAHATIFAVNPSTRTHVSPGRTSLYVAREGTLRGFIDYRIEQAVTSLNNGSTNRRLLSHDIARIRVKQDGRTIAATTGTHTPIIDYRLSGTGRTTLTLEADIEVRIDHANGTSVRNETQADATIETETITVSDSLSVMVYALSPDVYSATYPDGDTGIATFQSVPWQGYSLADDGRGVRGVWRFYTARDPRWDTLVQSSAEETRTVDSEARPVFIHAYPSEIGPRTEPVRDGPTLLSVWGIETNAPHGTIGENVRIDLVNQSYTASYGLALRSEAVDWSDVRIHGIVRDVNVSLAEPTERRQIRESTLETTIVEQNESQALIQIELHDAETGSPIVLAEPKLRRHLLDGRARVGYIEIGNQRVETNDSGVALVTLSEPGIYRVQYKPGSWLSHDPAYTSASKTIRWHPLTRIDGWFALLVEVGWQFIPFFLTYYAGTRLLRSFGIGDSLKERYP